MSDFEKTSQRDPQEQNSGTSKRYESNSHNMFERRLAHDVVAGDERSGVRVRHVDQVAIRTKS